MNLKAYILKLCKINVLFDIYTRNLLILCVGINDIKRKKQLKNRDVHKSVI